MGAGTTALVGMGVSALSSSIGAGVSARRAARRAREMRLALENFENNRQDVINPYAGVEDLSDMATNLSDRITNPFADLAVATQAAEMQAEEADIALANTLDTLRATGASAGGATALAQAALQSKKQVSASIQLQEAQNQKLYAQGEERLNQMKMQEEQRLQSADVMGQQFMFGAQEQREVAKLNRTAGMLDNAQQDLRDMRAAEAKAEANMFSSIGNVVGGIGSLIGG